MTEVSKPQPVHAIELAQFIIAAYPEKGITPMKLQKLAYYAKSWTLVAQAFVHPSRFREMDLWPGERLYL
ncbi:MAG: hypothetical protein D3922_02895 [Candidatus Electrothrix sp. AR1]|nr:hypothetical protein [Candidatus Electrothrix sp. AR1]